ncbi:MAG: hypothetical protein LIO59_07305 [Oscillospiraceae bacterium]|nr:hypothetical protein [Oscillospiraceae bacterium]
MAQTILLKRGVQTDISNLTLEYGEVALAYNEDKTAIALYGGDGNGGLVLINSDVSDDTSIDLSAYSTTEQMNSAISEAVATETSAREAADSTLQTAIDAKLDSDSTIDGGTF